MYFERNTHLVTIVTTRYDDTKSGYTDLVEIDLMLITIPSKDSISHFDDTHFEYLDLLESASLRMGFVTSEEFHSTLQRAKRDVFAQTNVMNKDRVLNAIVQDVAADHGWKLKIESMVLFRRNDATRIHRDPTAGLTLWILLDNFVDRFTLAFEHNGIWTQPKTAFFGHAALFRGQKVQHGSFEYCAHPPCVTKERTALAVNLAFDYSDPELNKRMLDN